MNQLNFPKLESVNQKRNTLREKLPERMDTLVLRPRLERKRQKHYPKATRGRPPHPLETMLHIHCTRLCYNLFDSAMEDTIYEIESMHRFTGLKLSDALPDETTSLDLRHLQKHHEVGDKVFQEANRHLKEQGLLLRKGSTVDARIIDAPGSTKIEEGQRDPDVHQTRRGQQWHFGKKMHTGDRRHPSPDPQPRDDPYQYAISGPSITYCAAKKTGSLVTRAIEASRNASRGRKRNRNTSRHEHSSTIESFRK